MGSTSKHGRARIDPSAPEALGICDRCGFLYNLRQLHFQFDWDGTGMVNQQVRACRGTGTRGCYDQPQPQKRTIILPPDPPPLYDVRPEPYDVDNQNHYTLRALLGRPYMFPATGLMTAGFSPFSDINLTGLIDGVGDVLASMQISRNLIALLDGVGDVAVATQLSRNLTALLDGADSLEVVLTQVTPSGVTMDFTDSFIIDGDEVSPFTETGASIGAADANRIVLVAVQGIIQFAANAPIGISAMTIGGITARRANVILGFGGAGVQDYADLWWAVVPTGTTANIAVTFGGFVSVSCAVYRSVGALTARPFHDYAIDLDTDNNVQVTVNIPASSATVAGALTGGDVSPGTSTMTNITEDADLSFESAASSGLYIFTVAGSREDSSSAGNVAVSAASGGTILPESVIQATVLSDDGNVWIVLAAGSSFSVPANWNNADNSIHAFGSGAQATDPAAVGGGGAGGGAWARTDNVTLTPGGSATYQLGANGTDTWLSNTGVAPTSTSEGVLAKGGVTNSGITGGAGGASGSCIGTAANSGGNGGAGSSALNRAGAGGGAAGGPNGVGAAGGAASATNTNSGGGGGGANGGGTGNTGAASSAPGGINRWGFTWNTSLGDGAPGFMGCGGMGKVGASAGTAAGDIEPLFWDSSTGAAAGPGSGGGGGRGNLISNATATGGNGGPGGGGAGGSGEDATAHATGGPGRIVIRYRP